MDVSAQETLIKLSLAFTKLSCKRMYVIYYHLNPTKGHAIFHSRTVVVAFKLDFQCV